MREFPTQVGPATEPVSDSGAWTSSNANDTLKELQQAVESSGQTLVPLSSSPDNTQLSTAMAKYASGAIFGTDSGAPNNYVVSLNGSFTNPNVLFSGLFVQFRAQNANTGASTINAFGLGAKAIVKPDGSPLDADYITVSQDTLLRYDSTSDSFIVVLSRGVITEIINDNFRSSISYNGTSNTILYSSNVDSVVDNGIGDYTVNFSINFSSSFFSVSGTADRGVGVNTVQCFPVPISKSTSSCNMFSISNSNTNFDVILDATFIGD